MQTTPFEKYMKEQSVFMLEMAKTDGITIVQAVEKYAEYFRDEYIQRFEWIDDMKEGNESGIYLFTVNRK